MRGTEDTEDLAAVWLLLTRLAVLVLLVGCNFCLDEGREEATACRGAGRDA